jgi:hypothetical protein
VHLLPTEDLSLARDKIAPHGFLHKIPILLLLALYHLVLRLACRLADLRIVY